MLSTEVVSMELIKSKTYLNLAKAYAGECMARTRYEMIEYGARQQGYTFLAELIDEIAYNEFNHARMLYSFIQTAKTGKIDNIDICSGYPFREKWDLVENLHLAAEDEEDEATRIYPMYAKIAYEEGFKDIGGLFENLSSVETCHSKRLKSLHEQFSKGTAYKKEKSVKWKCSACGYEAEGKEAFAVCPLCQAKQGVVQLQEE